MGGCMVVESTIEGGGRGRREVMVSGRLERESAAVEEGGSSSRQRGGGPQRPRDHVWDNYAITSRRSRTCLETPVPRTSPLLDECFGERKIVRGFHSSRLVLHSGIQEARRPTVFWTATAESI